MKKITKILIAIGFLLTAISIQAQQSCATICHNGTLVKAIGGSAIDGHLNHHSEDILISTDCDYEIIGNECELLSVKKISINDVLPLGKTYSLFTIHGQLLRVGIIDANFKSTLPIRDVYLLKIEGYKTIKFQFK